MTYCAVKNPSYLCDVIINNQLAKAMESKANQPTAQPVNASKPLPAQLSPLPKQIEKPNYQDASDKIKAIASGNALRILAFMQDNPDQSVTDISKGVGIEQSLVSHHLTKLKMLGVLKHERTCKNSHYRISDTEMVSMFFALVSKL